MQNQEDNEGDGEGEVDAPDQDRRARRPDLGDAELEQRPSGGEARRYSRTGGFIA